MSFPDTPPRPLSQQQLVDCTVGLTQGEGTELFRKNQGCVSAVADIHLNYVRESGIPLQSAEQYPLEPNKRPSLNPNSKNQCDIAVNYYDFEDNRLFYEDYIIKCMVIYKPV